MKNPSSSDPSFKEFLEKLQDHNQRGFATQLLQLKADREIAGEDGDKREQQLDDVILALKEVREAVTGTKLQIDIQPLVNIGENQTRLLEELSKEAALTRKLTEGSVEYDKTAAQYRNTSGRDVESKVSGKTSRQGGFLDFETARDTLSGQSKRVRDDNTFDLKPINYTPGKAVAAAVSGGKGSAAASRDEDLEKTTSKGFFKELEDGFKFFMTEGLSEKSGYGIFQQPPKEVTKKNTEVKVSSPRQVNPEADNVNTSEEIIADTAKSDLELSKQMLDTTKQQLIELKAIREALAPSTPSELVAQKSAPSSTNEKGEGGGSLLGDLATGAAGLLGKGKSAAGKVAGAAKGLGAKVLGGAKALGGKAVGFANTGAGKLLGSAAAVGLGAYTAYSGYNTAEDSKDAKLKEVQAQFDAGEISSADASAQRKEIGNTATVEKSGAVGEGTGLAAGAIAGAKLGATVGTLFGGPVGTAVGGLAGGAIGAFAGSKAGKVVGEYGGKAINTVGNFIGKVGDKVKDVYNRGTSGTLAFQNKEEEVFNRAKAAGIIDEKGEITDFEKYNQISKQVTKEIKSKDASASTLSEVSVGSKNDLKQSSITQGGVSTSTSEFKSNITSEKSVLGSTTLGSLFSAKGLEVGGFTGQSEKSRVTEGKVEGREVNSQEQKLNSVLGRRIASGSLFKPDSYKVADSLGKELDVTKSEYNKIQNLTKEGKTEEAEKLLAYIKSQREVAPGITPITGASAEQAQAARSNFASVDPRRVDSVGVTVAKTSTENADMTREAGGRGGANNTVVSNNVSSNNSTKIVPMKASPRPEYTGSSLDRYTNRITSY